MGRGYPRVWSDLVRRVAGGGVVAVAVAAAAAGRDAAGQCNYEITAVIAAIPLAKTVACRPPSSEASVRERRVKLGFPERV